MVATGEEIERLHAVVRDVPAAENVIDYAARLVRATRPAGRRERRARLRPQVGALGRRSASRARRCCSAPRLARCSKAGAWSSLEDIRAVALPVLRHRVLLNFQAEADEVDADAIVRQLLERIR